MSEIFDEVMAFFIEEDWPVKVLKEGESIETQFRGDTGQWPCYVRVDQDANQLAFYSVCPALAPVQKRLSVAEFITRANFGLMMGNFELNFEDGQLRYKTSLDVEDAGINTALIKNLIFANLTLMNLYLPGLMRVIYTDKTPPEIIEEIEA